MVLINGSEKLFYKQKYFAPFEEKDQVLRIKSFVKIIITAKVKSGINF